MDKKNLQLILIHVIKVRILRVWDTFFRMCIEVLISNRLSCKQTIVSKSQMEPFWNPQDTQLYPTQKKHHWKNAETVWESSKRLSSAISSSGLASLPTERQEDRERSYERSSPRRRVSDEKVLLWKAMVQLSNPLKPQMLTKNGIWPKMTFRKAMKLQNSQKFKQNRPNWICQKTLPREFLPESRVFPPESREFSPELFYNISKIRPTCIWGWPKLNHVLIFFLDILGWAWRPAKLRTHETFSLSMFLQTSESWVELQICNSNIC